VHAGEAAAELLLPVLDCSCSRTGGSAVAGLGLLPDREEPPAMADLLLREVEDEADVWVPPGSERSYGIQLSEREREE
jgi:hypothetical protein